MSPERARPRQQGHIQWNHILAFHIDAHVYRRKDLNVLQCFHYSDYGCGTSQKVVDLDDTEDFNLMRFGDRITG